MASGLIFDDDGNDVTMQQLGDAVEAMAGPWLNPDCWAGKHRACAGDAWDEEQQVLTGCLCPCHDHPDDHPDAPPVTDVETGGRF